MKRSYALPLSPNSLKRAQKQILPCVPMVLKAKPKSLRWPSRFCSSGLSLSVPSPLILLFAYCLHLSHWSCFKCLATPRSLLPQDLCTSSGFPFLFLYTLLDSDTCRSWPQWCLQHLSQVRSSCLLLSGIVSFFVYIPAGQSSYGQA